MSRPVCSTSLREVPRTVAPAGANVSEEREPFSRRAASPGTEAEGEDSESHDGVEGVAGDAARVLAISNEAHVAAFPPTGPPTEKIFLINIYSRNRCCGGTIRTMVLFP